MSYGWEIYDDLGNLIYDHTKNNLYFIDYYQTPADPNGHGGAIQPNVDPTKYSTGNYTFTKSYPEYKYSEIHVIGSGGTNVTSRTPYGESSFNEVTITITYPNSIPTVNIEITDPYSNISASYTRLSFWIVSKKISKFSPILNLDYGLNIFHKNGGIAYSPYTTPFYYVGRATKTLAGQYSNIGGNYYIDVDSSIDVAPLVFADNNIFGRFYIRKSPVQPTNGKTRWGFSWTVEPYNNTIPDVEAPSNILCFHAVKRNTIEGEYGIVIYGEDPYLIELNQGNLLELDTLLTSTDLSQNNVFNYSSELNTTTLAISPMPFQVVETLPIPNTSLSELKEAIWWKSNSQVSLYRGSFADRWQDSSNEIQDYKQAIEDTDLSLGVVNYSRYT